MTGRTQEVRSLTVAVGGSDGADAGGAVVVDFRDVVVAVVGHGVILIPKVSTTKAKATKAL